MGTYCIIGGSKGIGCEVATRLANEGHAVHVISRNRDDLPEGGITHHTLDVTAEGASFPDIGSPLDGLAYFPGSITLKPFDKVTRTDLYNDFTINVVGAMQSIQAYHKALKAKPGSSILLMSTVAVGTGFPFHSSISAAKGGVEGITRALAAELAPHIRVNAIAPTVVDSSLSHHLIDTDEKRGKIASNHPLNRIVSRQEAASAACYLLSEAASSITAHIMRLDAGISALQ
jgi:NAD(P)-dependent dehydrogenase (short-subunit alcohol dehydrogenase family)